MIQAANGLLCAVHYNKTEDGQCLSNKMHYQLMWQSTIPPTQLMAIRKGHRSASYLDIW